MGACACNNSPATRSLHGPWQVSHAAPRMPASLYAGGALLANKPVHPVLMAITYDV
jgi:hypothetical protein